MKKKILYVQTSGVDTPERTYAPFILAATAAAMGIDATIYFLIKGVTVVKNIHRCPKEFNMPLFSNISLYFSLLHMDIRYSNSNSRLGVGYVVVPSSPTEM